MKTGNHFIFISPFLVIILICWWIDILLFCHPWCAGCYYDRYNASFFSSSLFHEINTKRALGALTIHRITPINCISNIKTSRFQLSILHLPWLSFETLLSSLFLHLFQLNLLFDSKCLFIPILFTPHQHSKLKWKCKSNKWRWLNFIDRFMRRRKVFKCMYNVVLFSAFSRMKKKKQTVELKETIKVTQWHPYCWIFVWIMKQKIVKSFGSVDSSKWQETRDL